MAAIASSRSAQEELVLRPFDYGAVRALVGELGLAEPVAVTLVRRGYGTVGAARAFLDADEEHDPYEFNSMSEVVGRIGLAIEAGRRITVHGDYDVDGVCSTAILVRALRELGAEADWLIPDRLGAGYGLTTTSVEAIAARGGSLLITTDCGITSAAEVRAAAAAGLEVIVTDHHQPGAELPDCPILHPALSGYPCAELCATGVAFKLACALRGSEESRFELDLVALATVADMVPLLGENRTLVRRGIAEARRARRPGMRALLAACGVAPETLDEGDLGFRLGPRINAAGRLYRADAGVELMLSDDDERCARIAAELELANRERREVEDSVLREAEIAHRELPEGLGDAPGLVLAGQGWHPGVVGIVASRLAQRFERPVVLVALDASGGGRGSGRSVPGIDLLAALDSCAEHLVRHGGHRAAAGLELEAGRLEGFRRSFGECIAARLAGGEAAEPSQVDAVVGGESLGHEVAEQLARLGPFGKGNPEIRLLVPAARLGDVRRMGQEERHARFSIRSGPRRAQGVAFGVNGELDAAVGEPVDVSLRLELNHWNGAVEPRVVLGAIHRRQDEPEVSPGEPALDAGEYWDRFDAELAAELDPWPTLGETVNAGEEREVIERRRSSAVAAVAALASGGEPILVVAADALRRRELVERAARPARFGGAEVALAPGTWSRAAGRSAADRVRIAGSGVVLSDWAALLADPDLGEGFPHVVLVDPPPLSALARVVRSGPGYLHRLDDDHGARELSLLVLGDEWPTRDALAFCLRGIRRALAGEPALAPPLARSTLCGPGRVHPRGPETCARLARVLAEIGLLRIDAVAGGRTLTLVESGPKGGSGPADNPPSGKVDLARSRAFLAYRQRYEEARRYLNGLNSS